MLEKKNKRYLVLEQEDCENYLSETEQNILWEIQKKVLVSRHINGKSMKENYLVINRGDKKIQEIEKLLNELMEITADLQPEA